MTVIRTEEQLWEYVKNGYKPYLMKSVNRWYLRRGRERHIIDRSLEPLAKSIRERMLETELPPVPVSVIQDMRRSELPVQKISKATGLQRSTIYTALEKKPDEVIKPKPHVAGKVEIKEEVKTVNPLEEAWKNINESLNSVRKDADKVLKQLFSDKKFVENVEKLISLGIAHLGISLASNVKDEKLKQALLEGVRNVLEKNFLNAEAKATA
jgi:predicted transcriptional regulator